MPRALEAMEASVSHGPGLSTWFSGKLGQMSVSYDARGPGLALGEPLPGSQPLGYPVWLQETVHPAHLGPALQCVSPGPG